MRFRSLLIFSLIVLVSGCLGQTPEETLSTGQFIGGDKGLELSYVELPPRVFQNTPFEIDVMAVNEGETDIPVGVATFKLSNSRVFGLTEEEAVKINEESLAKAAEFGGFGGQTFITFEVPGYSGGVLSTESPVPISIDACYPYETNAVVDICIARSDFSEVCTPSEIKNTQNSGSPIHVSEVEQVLSLLILEKVRIGIIIRVEIKGELTDRIYSTAVEGVAEGTTCGERNSQFENQISIQDIRIGSATPYTAQEIESSCGSSIIGLNAEGKGRVQCNFEIKDYVSGAGDYVERMTIKLGYLHSTLANTNINIIPVE